MDEIYKRLHDDTEVEDDTNESSQIQEFFTGQTIFLTGCTGFLGKVFVEKILRSCPNIKRLYVLVRAKKQPAHERMKLYFDNMIFNRLKEEYPDFQSKVSTIEGDLMKDNLALSETEKSKLVEETTLIYHNASNVKFNEKINVSINTNVMGTRYMLDLAKQCKKLAAFVYVSTAYSHCYKQHIEEVFYPPPANMKMISDILDADSASANGMDEETLKIVRGQWPNNYCFTKSTAESLVEECAKEVPFACTVYRPSMVISTYQEPIRGWCGNINGPVGVIMGKGIGLFHALYKAYYPHDYVPADMCANALIALTWDAVVNKKVEKEGTVYNYGSSAVNKVIVVDFENKCFSRGQDLPSINMVGDYYYTFTDSTWHYWWVHLTVHFLTAVRADLLLLYRGEKPQVLSMWYLMTTNMEGLFYFASGNWRIHVERTQAMWDRMNRRDSELFFCDLRKLDWDIFCYAYWAGLRVYILKEPMETVNAGVRHYKTLKFMDTCVYYIVRILALYYVGRWLFSTLTSFL